MKILKFLPLLALSLISLNSLEAASRDPDEASSSQRRNLLISRESGQNQTAFLIASEEDQRFAQNPSARISSVPQEDPMVLEVMRQIEEAEKRAQEAEAKVSQQDRLLELMKQRDEKLKKAQEAEAKAAQQAQQMAEMIARLNSPITPPSPSQNLATSSSASPSQPSASPQGPQPSPVSPQPAKAAAASSPQAYSAPSVPRPVSDIEIPPVARGYEDIYRRFLNGFLIYNQGKPDAVRLPIRDLLNPLDGTFNLSQCGDTGDYLSISTGFRKGKKAENSSKAEIWLTPWFYATKALSGLPSNHYLREVLKTWDAERAPVGLFWTWGGWNGADHMAFCEYLTSESMKGLGSENLWEKYKKSSAPELLAAQYPWHRALVAGEAPKLSCFVFELK